MNVGSRVTTPDGRTGTIKHLWIDYRWAFNHPNVITWAGVKLDDDDDHLHTFHPGKLEEAPMNEDPQTSGVLIQPLDETAPAPEPEPVPDPTEPEPEGEEADEKLEELIEFPE